MLRAPVHSPLALTVAALLAAGPSASWLPAAASAAGAADDPASLVRAYWSETRAEGRSGLARRIEALPNYRPSRLRDWLHRGVPFPELQAGSREITATAASGETWRVFLVVPDDYRPDRAWPLVYALHPSGEPADRWAEQVRRMLGVRARQYVIASPEYRQNYVAAKPPFVAEHAVILDAVAREVHVDADRVYAFGYSRGGFAAWYVALYFPDRLAGAVSLAAGFDVAPGRDGFWKELAPNVAHLPVLNAWGERDPLEVKDLAEQPAGTFAESNRWFEQQVRGLRLPITNIEVPDGLHNQLAPPGAAVVDILTRERAADPPRVSHVFRHLNQSSCYWLEGLTWVGDSWGDPWPPRVDALPGESQAATLARTLEPLLGRLAGARDGQAFRITRRHVGDIVIWLDERSIDWKKPVTVECDRKVVFSGTVAPDVELALARAKATMDFEHPRFGGIRVSASGEASILTALTMPEPAWRR
jgi:pimeloyl-ACP methyl ester carboxylesterase